MKKITIGFLLLIIGIASVDSASQVAPLALMAVGMVLMYRGGKNEKLFYFPTLLMLYNIKW
mgnify:CR=1 FL=1